MGKLFQLPKWHFTPPMICGSQRACRVRERVSDLSPGTRPRPLVGMSSIWEYFCSLSSKYA